MLDVLFLVAGFAIGADPKRLAVLGLTVYFPWLLALLVVGSLWIATRRSDPLPAIFCEGVASELRAGAVLRDAVSSSAAAVGLAELASVARSGDLSEVAALVSTEFPGVGRELAVVIERSGRTGASTADIFDEVAALAIAQAEVRREVRVATAPAKAAAGLFILTPVVYLATRWAAGDLAALLAEPAQRVAAIVGLGLFAVGVSAASLILWRVR